MERAQRALDRARVADAKERDRLYHEDQHSKALLLSRALDNRIEQLTNLLSATLNEQLGFNLDTLKKPHEFPPFDPKGLSSPEPPLSLERYLPKKLSFLKGLLPGAKGRYEKSLRLANERYASDVEAQSEREETRKSKLTAARTKYAQEIVEIRRKVAAQHKEVEGLKHDYLSAAPNAINRVCELALKAHPEPEGFPEKFKLGYAPESKQLVIEYDIPTFEIVPEVLSHKYVKAQNAIVPVARSLAERRRLYSQLVASIALRVLNIIFSSDHPTHIDTLVFNGYVETIDRGTGHQVRKCIVTLRTTRDVFMSVDLRNVDPELCLKALNAEVSRSPAELVPVRPVLELNMVDPRFIQEADVLSTLDQRPNLMELTPSEFESLITNLFEKMGLETRLTQPSRDGGVDCVAFDPRPIFGGKVVIQAKRYKNTVGVSAVRDLFGTVQNEGASKGILVTTSGYGKASFDFAQGKPLELLSGSNLLYLLANHSGVEAKIEPPESWKDPEPDSGE
ncbi:MAG: restriction endonuclease [Candidatus Binataceae bacterium]|nr:restriction endonuclease [Candidatus Binataceae bacterium]